MKSTPVNIILLGLILTGVSLGQGASTNNTRGCLDNGLTSIDEPSEDGDVFDEFLDKLSTYTGLNALEPFNVTMNCEGGICVVNPNGTAIWDARMALYLNNMISNATDAEITIDQCQCSSANLETYRDCMAKVRQNMIAQLDTVYVETFRSIVESDNCSSFKVNCVTSLSE